MAWHGVVNVKATLETEYEFDDDLLTAETEEEARTKTLAILHDDILNMSYRKPGDLLAWLQNSVQYELRTSED